MKQDKNGVPMTNGTSHPPSEGRGGGDIDATTLLIIIWTRTMLYCEFFPL